MRIEGNGQLTMGYDEAGAGGPLLLIHGFPLSRAMWRLQLAGLAGEARVIAPDLRGFGETAGFTGAPSIDQMADDVASLLDRLGLSGPVSVAGLSMGGYVALAFARRHAQRLRALILADTRSEPDDEAGKVGRDKMIALAEQKGAAGVIERMMPKMVGEETRKQRPQVAEEVVRIATAQSAEGVVSALEALRDRPDAGPALGSIRVPTLVLVGEEDAITPPAMSERLAAAINGARLVRIPGAGHLSNLERPELFNDAVREFLRSLG